MSRVPMISMSAGAARGKTARVAVALLLAAGGALGGLAATGASAPASGTKSGAGKSGTKSGGGKSGTQSAGKSGKKSAGKEGWGPQKAFLGRYHVKIPSGPFHSSKGQLTLFMQEEFPHAPLTPAGILSLHTKKGTELLYLTSLTAKGRTRHATVTGGDFSNGPTLGSFSGSSTHAGRVSGTLKARGVGTFKVTFVRFSKNPQP